MRTRSGRHGHLFDAGVIGTAQHKGPSDGSQGGAEDAVSRIGPSAQDLSGDVADAISGTCYVSHQSSGGSQRGAQRCIARVQASQSSSSTQGGGGGAPVEAARQITAIGGKPVGVQRSSCLH
ncbi:hypothetical protein TYRP_022992 [Tyrophagus putrescentiae]|nr:hypothetical protein TYRP_022992 [Tyrophagus putrescentiae]